MSTIRTPDGAVVGVRYGSGVVSYAHTDHQGSVITLTDAAGTLTGSYSYDPYGTHHTATGTAAAANPYRYISGYLDTTTGHYKLGIRYYNPDLGRFTQPDPTGAEPNPYLYATGDPINRSDPEGSYSLGEGIFFVSGELLVCLPAGLGSAALSGPGAIAVAVGCTVAGEALSELAFG
jgi:RHS repeat-associated protein